MIKKLFLIVFLVLVQTVVFSANISSTTTGGLWSATTTWVGGVVPSPNDNVTVVSGSNITLDTNLTIGNGNYTFNGNVTDNGTHTLTATTNGGVLIISNSSTTTIGGSVAWDNSTITVNTGSTLIIGPLVIDNGTTITIAGSLYVNGDVTDNNNGGSGSSFSVTGYVQVYGNYNAPVGSVSVTGAGVFQTTGTITTNGSSTVGGSTNNCTVGPCSSGSISCGNGTDSYFSSVSPTNQTLCSGQAISSLTFVSGTTVTSYQWQISTTSGGSGFTNISGATSSTYSPSQPTVTTWYRMKYSTSSCSNLISPSSKITVNNNTPPVAGTISGGNVTYCSNTNSTTMTLSGYTASGFQWQSSSDNSTFVNISGATSSSYTASNVSSTTYYRVVVYNGSCNTVNSSSVAINKSSAPSAPTGSASQLFCSGFTVASLVATGTSIQWYAASSGGSPLATTVTLVNGTHYYASQTTVCESTSRLDVTVTISDPAVPSITVTPATCFSSVTSTITNYNASYTYTFNPATAGITINASTGLISGMTIGTTYTVTASNASCTSAASGLFSNAPMKTTPAVPTITTTAATCSVAGTSTISNYSASNTYTFNPATAGITINASGLISGMTIGTSYTVTSGNASCTSASSSSFSNAAVLTAPAVPTITTVAATCLAAGTSTISNYSASNTYTFNPATAGITINASGLISGMTIGTSYTVTSGNGSCTSASSSSFSNAAVLTAPAAPTITAGGSTTFCTGGSVTLTSSVGTGYLWSTGATTASISPTTAGSYTVQVTNASGCLSTASTATVVTVNALPTISSVSAPAAICKGSSATITLASITGTGSSYNLYDASSGGTLIGAIPQTVSPTISTTYYLEAISSAGCLSSSRTAVVVTVRSLVDNTATGFSSSSFCTGSQATITFDANNGSGVYPYTLSYRNDSTLAVYSQTIPNDNSTTFNLTPNPTVTTHYTLLSITDTNGCVNSSPSDNGATATITSLPVAPTIGTITNLTCALATGSVDLSGLPATWTLTRTGTSSATTSGTGTSTTISGLASGTYNFTVTNSSGCTSSAANVSINALVTNTWDGTAWSNVTAPTSDQNIVFDGTFSSSADLAGCSCLVKAGRNVTINPSHTLTITNAVTVEPTGILKFKSDLNPPLSNSASLVQINNVSNSGDIIYERLTNTSILNTDYTYWSSPVASFTLGGVSPNTLSNKFYSFDDTTQNWKQESTATTMIAGRGYIIRGPESFPPNPPSTYLATFTGVPNNGTYTITGVAADNLYLLGNPYPSAINADQFLNENSGVLDGTLYFWTHNTAFSLASSVSNPGSGMYAYSSDDYASYNLTGGVGTASAISDPSYPGGKIPNGKITAGQGFFASSIVSPSGTTIVYNNDIRITGTSGNNSQFFKTSNIKSKTASVVEKNRIWLALSNSQGAFKQTLVGYLTNATNEYDSRFDGESFDGNTFVDFYSVLEDKNLTIQGRALPFDKNDVVPLGFRSTIRGNFTIAIDQTDGLFTNQAVFLEDKLTNTFFNLKRGSYAFATETGTFNDRFVLHYTDKTLGTTDFDTQTNSQVLVSVKNKQLTINSFEDSIDKIVVYDLLGRQIFQKNNINNNEFTTSDILVSSHQTLVVKTVLKSGKTVNSKIIF